jgi:hypothetical protein
MTSGIFKNYYKDNPRHFQVKKTDNFSAVQFFSALFGLPRPGFAALPQSGGFIPFV